MKVLGEKQMRLCMRIAGAWLALGAAGLSACAPNGAPVAGSGTPQANVPAHKSIECPGGGTVNVAVNINTTGPAQDQKFTIAELTKMSLADDPAQAKDRYTFGYTEGEYKADYSADLTAREYEDAWCAFAVRARIAVDLSIDVHLASELIPGTCLYRSVVEHENKHVASIEDGVSRRKAALRAAATKALERPVRAPDVNSAQKVFEARLHDTIDPIVKEMGVELRRRQKEIDTPEEYARVQAICPKAESRAAVFGTSS